MPDLIPNHQWVVARFKTQVVFTRDRGEAWIFNAGVRYVLNSNLMAGLEPHIDEVSTLSGMSDFNPLRFPLDASQARILVERYRGRGLGDLLFMTGPMAWIQASCGHEAKIYTYTLASRLPVLAGNPALAADPGVGPVHYGSLRDFHFHWLVESATEYAVGQQPNVYDALYRQIGVDPGRVGSEFKRPTVAFNKMDHRNFDHFSKGVSAARGIDLSAGFVMVAPMCQSQLRTADYGLWLEVVAELAKARPVLVLGNLDGVVLDSGMPVGQFSELLGELERSNPNVVNAVGPMPLRTMMMAAARASLVVCLDSGPLYAAQASRTPAVSLWGPTGPASRIGHDSGYMELAVHLAEKCRNSPCHAWREFPAHLCPAGERQTVCSPLAGITLGHVMEKVELAVSKRVLV